MLGLNVADPSTKPGPQEAADDWGGTGDRF